MKLSITTFAALVGAVALCFTLPALRVDSKAADAAKTRLAPDGVNTIKDLGGGVSSTTLAHVIDIPPTLGWSISVPDEILLVTDLRREEVIRFPQDPTRLTYAKFFRPEKPEEIVVTITTADGKKWRARWEPVPATDSTP